MNTSNTMATEEFCGPHLHVTGLRCPRCASTLFRRSGRTRILAGDQAGAQLMCVRCRSFWEGQPLVRAEHQVLIVGGACALFVTSVLAAAIWAGASSVCSEVTGGLNPRCVDKPSILPGIPPEVISSVAVAAAALGAVKLALTVGRRTLRGYWWHLALWMLVLGMAAGTETGIHLTKRHAPEEFWSNPDLWMQFRFAAATTVVLLLTSGVIITRQQERDGGRWHLMEVFPGPKEGSTGGNRQPPGRWRVVPEFYDPAPYTPQSRDES